MNLSIHFKRPHPYTDAKSPRYLKARLGLCLCATQEGLLSAVVCGAATDGPAHGQVARCAAYETRRNFRLISRTAAPTARRSSPVMAGKIGRLIVRRHTPLATGRCSGRQPKVSW